jgi:hypothetical protein
MASARGVGGLVAVGDGCVGEVQQGHVEVQGGAPRDQRRVAGPPVSQLRRNHQAALKHPSAQPTPTYYNILSTYPPTHPAAFCTSCARARARAPYQRPLCARARARTSVRARASPHAPCPPYPRPQPLKPDPRKGVGISTTGPDGPNG